MNVAHYRGYEIEPGHQYRDDIRKYVPYALIRKVGVPDRTPIPATYPEFYDLEADAERVSIACAKIIIDSHLDRHDQGLADLG
ncbi:Uncharacterised protein [Chromobacterium violaceum]|uniref:Uncharacterized protein n=2 Tax=Chromobacterium violaceum TaxID=536 RepID=Q7NW74_CHRVO|nr:hypothetical protein CV_2116 [Chromobacterium violaceum ATCC 12472]SUX35328.1 Uncharacterised protein [Chromobacterium violaceum]